MSLWNKSRGVISSIENKKHNVLFKSLSDPEIKIFINATSIQQVKETKLLVITLDNILSGTQHIHTLDNKMGQTFAVVGRCLKYFTPD